jgi:hypothetical protein
LNAEPPVGNGAESFQEQIGFAKIPGCPDALEQWVVLTLIGPDVLGIAISQGPPVLLEAVAGYGNDAVGQYGSPVYLLGGQVDHRAGPG